MNALIARLSNLMFALAGVALTAMMLLTAVDVVLRTISRPFTGAYELVGLLGALALGLSLPQTTLAKGHVRMDMLTDRLTSRGKARLAAFTRLLGLGFFAVAGVNLFALGENLRQANEVTLTLQVPQHPVAYVLALCCFVECLALLPLPAREKEARS
jgi:TRAP-type C4-dicarboxylate transport system permease small subunit